MLRSEFWRNHPTLRRGKHSKRSRHGRCARHPRNRSYYSRKTLFNLLMHWCWPAALHSVLMLQPAFKMHCANKAKGFSVLDLNIPIVPTAILFDLANGGDISLGERSILIMSLVINRVSDASGQTFELGSIGAGTGALIGGPGYWNKGRSWFCINSDGLRDKGRCIGSRKCIGSCNRWRQSLIFGRHHLNMEMNLVVWDRHRFPALKAALSALNTVINKARVPTQQSASSQPMLNSPKLNANALR